MPRVDYGPSVHTPLSYRDHIRLNSYSGTTPKRAGNALTTDDNASAEALAGAITTSRTNPEKPVSGQRTGRIDRRRLHRVAVSDGRVFKRNLDPAPNKVRCTILVDASGSMQWAIDTPDGAIMDIGSGEKRAVLAAQTTRNLAAATERLPWVTADVAAFTTGMGDCVYFPLWETGQPTSNIEDYGDVPMHGTEEGYAIAYALDVLLERVQPREQGLIIIVSDGEPSEKRHTQSVVATARDNGIPVVSIALTESAAQPQMYGRDNVIHWEGNTRKLAKDMAKVIGRVL